MNLNRTRRLPVKFLLAVSVVVSVSWITGKVTHPDTYYQKGKIIRFAVVTPARLNYKETYEIISETKSGPSTQINAVGREYDDAGKMVGTHPTRFYYDANHWAEEFAIGLTGKDLAMDGASESQTTDSLVYPYAMKINDTLRPATTYKKIALKGDYCEYRETVYNRKVMEKDTVQTSIGRITAFRIESKIARHEKRKHKMLGDKDESSIDYCTTWFSTEYGIVKTEVTTEYGMERTTLQSIQ